ncbi:MAG: hypothetical protein WCK27_27260, partial [Verrucomicrobiota bacterium]
GIPSPALGELVNVEIQASAAGPQHSRSLSEYLDPGAVGRNCAVLAQGGVTLGQLVEAVVPLNGLDDEIQFVGSHLLTVVPAVFTAL